MKLPIFNKVFNFLKLSFIFIFLFLVSTESVFNYSTSYTINNDDIAKAVLAEVIEDNQEQIYVESIEKIESVDAFDGTLTAYVGDCPRCSGVLACKPRTNVLESGVYFNDSQYGTVRIVASSTIYPCGTIIRFSNVRLGEAPVIAVVMDRGVSGNTIDLLVEDVTYAYKSVGTVRGQYFEVLRYGWGA